MSKVMCPGQDTRFWRPEDIAEVQCRDCGETLEFFKDEGRRKCPRCGRRVVNPKMSLGCAQWCEHAKQCLGFDPAELTEPDEHEVSLTDRLVEEMKSVFRGDDKRIDHALKVLDYSRRILREEDADPRVVLSAAVLHDIGIKEAEKKHGSSAGVYQEMEGPPIAERILKEIGVDVETMDHVLEIIGSHHSARGVDTPEFRVLWDADWLVNLPEEYPELSADERLKKIDKIMRTDAGRRIAREELA